MNRGDNLTVEGEVAKQYAQKKGGKPSKYSKGIDGILNGQDMVKEAKGNEKKIDENTSKIDSMKRLNQSRKEIKEKNN